MKTLIKLAILALIVNAAYQAVHSYYTYYTFKDELHQEVLSGNYNTSSEMHDHLVEMGKARGLKVDYTNFELNKLDELIILDFNYVDDVEFVPRVFSRPWLYKDRVSVHRLKRLKFDEEQRQYERR